MEVDKACCICRKELVTESAHEIYSYLDPENISREYCKLMCKYCYEIPTNRSTREALAILSLLSRTTKSTVDTYKQAYTDYLNKLKEISRLD